MMHRRSLFTVMLLALASALVVGAGCAPHFVILRQAVPNVLLGANSFAVEPVHFEALQVGRMPEAMWLASKTPEQQMSYQQDRLAMINRFVERMTDHNPHMQIVAGPPPGPQTFIIRPILTYIEPGFYAYVASRNTEARMTLQILTQQGQVLDEIVAYANVTANLYNPSTGGRLRTAADRLSDTATSYLRYRTGVN